MKELVDETNDRQIITAEQIRALNNLDTVMNELMDVSTDLD